VTCTTFPETALVRLSVGTLALVEAAMAPKRCQSTDSYSGISSAVPPSASAACSIASRSSYRAGANRTTRGSERSTSDDGNCRWHRTNAAVARTTPRRTWTLTGA